PTNADISTPAPAADPNAPVDPNAPAATPTDPGADPNAAPAENGPVDAPDPEDLQAPKTGVSGFLERMENVFTLLDVDKNEVKDEVIVEPDEAILDQEIDIDD